jgi:phage terminase Nu1 subunit (DNA packaging protein)
MQEYTETLENALQQWQEQSMPIPAKIGKIGGLAFELELVQTFLASFKQAYGTMH